MSLILAALLASNQALPFIDRSALHALAKREAATRPIEAAPVRKAGLAVLCSTAANLASSPRIAEGRAYSMSGPEVSILKSTCASYQASLITAKPTRLAAR